MMAQVSVHKFARVMLIFSVEDKILIFGTEMFVREAQNSSMWFMDGTFKSAPKLFEQIYSIHFQLGTNFFTLAVSLLPNKRKETYIRFLRLIKSKF